MSRKKQKIREIIIVEGKYDKIHVSQIVDTLIIETSGFRLFSDKDKMNLIRKLAQARGIIILTDSDSAGFIIRNHIKGCIPSGLIKHAYIPDMYGKEKRKALPSKEGKVGVEGMPPEVILDALRRAGATFTDESPREKDERQTDDAYDSGKPVNFSPGMMITVADLFDAGLTGRADSAGKRSKLLQALDLPERMSTGALLSVLNLLYTWESFSELIDGLFPESGNAEMR